MSGAIDHTSVGSGDPGRIVARGRVVVNDLHRRPRIGDTL
jgi:hypothetical protein